MANLGDLVVRIVGDNADLDRSIDQSQSKLRAFSDTAQRIGRSLTTFVTLPILGIGTAFVKTASDAEETNSKFNAVFKEQSRAVRDWASTFSESVGRSTTDNLRFLATIQDTLVPLGYQRDAAAEVSKATVQLATDLASFNNLPTEQVVMDIQSALVGNTETLRKYGVVASQSAIVQEALNLGLIDTASELDAAGKAQAIYSLLVKGTADAQGDAVRTAGSTANQFRALKATVTDLAISFGNMLLPTVNAAVEWIKQAVLFVTQLDADMKRIIITVAALAASVGPLLIAISSIQKLLLAASGPAGWITLAVVGVVALTTAIVELVRRNREYEALLYDTENAVKSLSDAEREQARLRLQEGMRAAQAQLRVTINQLAAAQESLRANRERAETDRRFLPVVAATEEAIDRVRERLEEERKAVQDAREALETLDRVQREQTETTRTQTEVVQTADVDMQALVDTLNNMQAEVVDLDFDLGDLNTSLETMGTNAVTARAEMDALATALIELHTESAEANRKAAERAAEDAKNLTNKIQTEEAKRLRLSRERTDAQLAYALWGYYEETEIARDRYQDEKDEAISFAEWYETNYVSRIADATQRLADTIIDIVSARADAEIAAIEASTMAEEDKERAIIAIKQREAIASKRVAIFNAIVDTAQAIIGFLAEPGGIAGIILSATAAATGAAQIAAIEAQPIPQLAAGGVVTGPTTAVVGEGGVPEAVIPLDQLGSVLAEFPALASGGEGMMHVTVQMDSKPILDKIFPASRDRAILIDARAVV
jgi:hypothetical protein